VEILKPLAVGDIRLAAGHVLDVARVDEAHLQSPCLENLQERDPEHPGRLHRDRADATRLKPVGQGIEILRERLELPDRARIALGRDRDVNPTGPNVDARRIQADHS
jgi:hypothetical protein